MNLKKYVHRGFEELRATSDIAGVVGWPEALATLKGKIEIQRMCRDGYQEGPSRKAALLRKHEIMLDYFEKRYGEFFNSYSFTATVPDDDPAMRGKVWACWWQGEDNAPAIVKRCLQSVRSAAGEHEVIVLNDNNYREYADMPDWIVDKYNKGIISRTQFSDVLRFTLLSQHGGIWLDATMYCSAPLPSDAFERDLFTISRPDCDHMSVAAGRFSDFCFGCNYESRRIFATIRDACYRYWETNDTLVDYLTNDYMIVLMQKLDPEYIGRAFAAIKPSNPRMADLLVHLNDPYDVKLWKEITSQTSLFKLSWKTPAVVEAGGKKTFYGKLIKGSLVRNA